MNIESPETTLLYAGFNQDYGCFAAGTTQGFKIYNCDPLKEKMRKDFPDGGIGHIEMLFRCNFLALVGGGKNPKFPPNKVMIWDDMKNKVIIELEFRSAVKAVRMRRDRIVVCLETKIFVYAFSHAPQKLYVFETGDNARGLCALCYSATNALLAFPGKQKGHVQLVDLIDPRKASSIIPAHQSDLSCIAFNMEGTKIATSSEKGTLIRVYDSESGRLLNELRRGTDRAVIYSIAFSADSARLCASSDKGTVHVFDLEAEQTPNRQSSLKLFKDVLPKYFSSEWSFAHFTIAEERCICAFGADRNSVLVICADGSFYKYLYDPKKGGECYRESFNKFL